jgi:hypothetical protein
MWLIVAYCNKYISENYVLTPIFPRCIPFSNQLLVYGLPNSRIKKFVIARIALRLVCG